VTAALQISGFERSPCPVAAALDLFGDRWTLVVVRDLTVGKKRFGDFLKSPEKIPTNILADRLKQLETAEVIRRTPYQTRPLRHEYRLTPKGAAMLPILQAMARWSNAHLPGTWRAPEHFLALTPEDVTPR
jgi:DNA-binding HxlR family transcriptional regulator